MTHELLVVQKGTKVQGVSHAMDARVRAVVRMLR